MRVKSAWPVALLLMAAAVFFIRGVFKLPDLSGFDQRMPFLVGYGVGLISILLVIVLCWSNWFNRPPDGGGQTD